MSVNLVIKMVQSGGTELPISANLSSTIAELKEQIATPSGLPAENIRLVCAGRIWQDVATLGSYEPSEGAKVHCLNNPARATPPAAEQTLSAVNPMQAMLGGGAPVQPAANGGDPMAQMMAQSQQMMMQNPEMMEQMMNSPMVQQMLSNPETLRSMMSMNPQMSQLMEQRPEIARLLEDPETIRQSMQMMRNPGLMQEMQRNADRAIGQLDVMPGGHNALVRAHEDMVDPLMNALSGSGQGTTPSIDLAAYAQQAEGMPNNAALPNPWGAPAATTSSQPSVPAAPAVPAFGGGFPAFGAQAPTAPQSQPNPMADMMQQMMSNPAMMQQSMQMLGGQQGAGLGTTPTTTPPAAGNADPMAAAMQQMMSNPAMMQQSMQMASQMFGGQQGAGLGATPAVTPTPAGNADPMAAAMQQMMSNPAMMQQSMQMASQMFGGQQGAGLGETPAVTPPTNADPFAAMMQQMMSNPAMVQQSTQNMFGNQGAGASFPGMFGAPPMALANDAGQQDPSTSAPATDSFVRARFAAQLAQLSAMGFCNEAAALRALQQHQGRIDAAIDTLLSEGAM